MQSQEKPTKYGIISSILAISFSVLWGIFMVVLMIITQQEVTRIDINNTVLFALLFYGSIMVMVGLTPLVTITGMVLSALSIRKGEPKRFFAIPGFLIHFLFLLPFCFSCVTFFMPLDS